MTRHLHSAGAPQRRISASVGAALLSVSLLAGCGSEGSGATQAPEPPTQEELDGYLASTGEDAKQISEEVLAAYRADEAFPDSAEGLGTLSEGNHLGIYEADANSARICVEHRIGGEGVAFSSYLVNAAGGMKLLEATPLSTGTNSGCI